MHGSPAASGRRSRGTSSHLAVARVVQASSSWLPNPQDKGCGVGHATRDPSSRKKRGQGSPRLTRVSALGTRGCRNGAAEGCFWGNERRFTLTPSRPAGLDAVNQVCDQDTPKLAGGMLDTQVGKERGGKFGRGPTNPKYLQEELPHENIPTPR